MSGDADSARSGSGASSASGSIPPGSASGQNPVRVLVEQATYAYAATDRDAPEFTLGPISFEGDRREVISILGPNASGKSTMLKLLAGVLKPLSGRVQIDGSDASELDPADYQSLNHVQMCLHALNVAPEIVQLQQSAEQMRRGELRRLASRLQTLSPEQLAAVEALTRGLVNKFLHQPVQAIKAAASEGNTAAVDAIREAFGASRGDGRAGVEAFEADATEDGLISATLDEERDR